MTEYGKTLTRHRDADPGAGRLRAARPRRQPRLVQGELAAREDDGRRPARLRPGAEQHLLQRRRGTTRGIHAEPWDKFVSVATGRVFGAWVDLREGPTFGTVFTAELDPSRAVFVPRGVGNAYQTLEPTPPTPTWSTTTGRRTPAYTVAEPRRRDRRDRLADPAGARRRSRRRTSANPRWPTSTRSRRGRPWSSAPTASSAARCARRSPTRRTSSSPSVPSSTSRSGRLGARAPLARVRRGAQRRGLHRRRRRRDRRRARAAWAANATGRRALARLAAEHGFTLVHFSTDYVFDGTAEAAHRGRAVLPARRLRPDQGRRRHRRGHRAAPLHRPHIVGDRRRPQLRAHHAALAERGVAPTVVDDQVGRLTFTAELARGDPALLGDAARRTGPTT